MLIFTKGANISGGHCMYTHTHTYTHTVYTLKKGILIICCSDKVCLPNHTLYRRNTMLLFDRLKAFFKTVSFIKARCTNISFWNVSLQLFAPKHNLLHIKQTLSLLLFFLSVWLICSALFHTVKNTGRSMFDLGAVSKFSELSSVRNVIRLKTLWWSHHCQLVFFTLVLYLFRHVWYLWNAQLPASSAIIKLD